MIDVLVGACSHLFKPTNNAASVFESAFGQALADQNAGTDAERTANEIAGKFGNNRDSLAPAPTVK